MAHTTAILTIITLAGLAAEPERVETEEAKKFARFFVEQAAKLDGLQLKVDPDPARPYLLKLEDMGVLAIPDKGLAADAIDKAGKEATPIGQLWCRNLTAIVKEQPVPSDRLRIVTVKTQDREHSVALFLLGVRKSAEGAPELVIYAREKEPLVILPLEKVNGNAELPIELHGKADEDRGVLTLRLAGKYRAQLVMTRQEP